MQELTGEGGGIHQAAQRMWTSAANLRGKKFCSILNGAVRGDSPRLAGTVADLCRAINQLCVSTNGWAVHPPGNVCYRGGGFDDQHQAFLRAGMMFRQPAYLATSFDPEKAKLVPSKSECGISC